MCQPQEQYPEAGKLAPDASDWTRAAAWRQASWSSAVDEEVIRLASPRLLRTRVRARELDGVAG